MFDLKKNKNENKNNEVVITKKEKPTKISSTKTGIREGDEVVLLSNDGKKEGFFAYSTYKVQKLNRTKDQFLFFDEVILVDAFTGATRKYRAEQVFIAKTQKTRTSTGIHIGEEVILTKPGNRIDDLKAGKKYIVVDVDSYTRENSPYEEVGLWDENYTKIRWYKLADIKPVRVIKIDTTIFYDYADVLRMVSEERLPLNTKVVNINNAKEYALTSSEGQMTFIDTKDGNAIDALIHNFVGRYKLTIPDEKHSRLRNPLFEEGVNYLNYHHLTTKYLPGSATEDVDYKTRFLDSDIQKIQEQYGLHVLDGWIKEPAE